MHRVLSFAICSLVLALSPEAFAAAGRTPVSFDVSPTGEATYSIPIFTPPGIRGMTPQLALVYNHRSEATLAGVGWGVQGLSVIARCQQTWAQDGTPRDVRNDYNDKFCIDGNRLRLLFGTYGTDGAEYRTEIETFSRIKSFAAPPAGNGPRKFVVERKDGLIHEYGDIDGASGDALIESVGQSTARLWALKRIRDRQDNAILFTYIEDTSNGSFRISRVDYTNNPGLAPKYRVEFFYETKPSNEIDSGYVAGSVVKEITRLNYIDVTHEGALVRRYNLHYQGALSSASRSRLWKVIECTDTAETNCYPETVFTYRDGTPGMASEVSTGVAVPWLLGPMDVNGDGREDLVYVSSTTSGAGTWMVMFANSSGGYGGGTNTLRPNDNYGGAIPIDYNADGLEDVLVPYSGGTWWIMLGTTTGFGALTNTGAPVMGTGTGSNAAAIDINGDGLQDLVWAELFGYAGGDVIRYRLRVSGGAFSATATDLISPQPPDNAISSGMFNTAAKRFPKRVPDFNGDGRGDIVYKVTQRIWIEEPWPGHFLFFPSFQVICPGGPSFGAGVGAASPLHYGDFNGDGKTDLLYYTNSAAFELRFSTGTGLTGAVAGPGIAPYGASYFVLDWDSDGYDDLLAPHMATATWHVLRSSGEGLQTAVSTGLPFATATSPPIVTDLNGDGLHDIGYTVSTNVWRSRLHSGVMPDLLAGGTDGFGNAAQFAYTPITHGSYTKGDCGSFPNQCYWRLDVASTLTAPNGIGASYTRTYHYETARFDLQGRGAKGFGVKRSDDSRNLLRTRETYGQSFPHIGVLSSRSVLRPSGETISRAEFSWSAHTYSGLDGSRSFPFVSNINEYEYRLTATSEDDPMLERHTTNSVDAPTGTLYDQSTWFGETYTANGVLPSWLYYQRTYHPTRLDDFTNWCLGRPQVTQEINSHETFGGAQIARQTNTAWDPVECRPTQTVEQPGDGQLQLTTDFAYDDELADPEPDFGNLGRVTVTGIGMAPRVTTLNWGTRGQFPASVTQPVSSSFSETTSFTWNFALGLQASETDANGLLTEFQYDAFGRRVREGRADGTDTTWTYEDCAASACVSTNNKLRIVETFRDTADATITDARFYLDTLDRVLVESRRQRSGAYDRIDTIYDSLGRVSQRSVPCWWSSCAYFWTSYQYDLLDRQTHESRPVSETDPTTQTTATHYEGVTTRVVDALGKESRTIANVLGWVVRSADHSGHYQHFDYDAFGNLIRVADSLGATLHSATYNVRGMVTASSDIDRGDTTFVPNALGEITSQTDEKGQTTSFFYDFQSRPTSSSMPGTGGPIVRTWTWGQDGSASVKNVGNLAWMEVAGPGLSTYRETYSYNDPAGRLVQTKYTVDATNYFFDYAYHAATGFLQQIMYPTSTEGFRFKLRYDYQNGHTQRLWNFDNNNQFWIANASDARGNVTDLTLGESTNGATVAEVSAFDKMTGLLQSRQSTFSTGTAIENLGFLWDRVGNLTQRQDNRQGLTENFYYDNLHRLDHSTLGAVTTTYAYDARGNLTSKTGVGSYSYTGSAPGCTYYSHAQIHAVRQITGGTTLNFCYDANGNMTNRNGTTISWYADDMPKAIVKDASNSSTFEYTPDGRRWKHVYRIGGADHTQFYFGALMERVTTPTGNIDWKHYVLVDGEPVALYIRRSSGEKVRYFFTKDHLGGVASISHTNGTYMLRESFDAHGKRRGSAWSGTPDTWEWNGMLSITRRGFTFHEHLDSTDLIHMNGRVYDSFIGRFASADPFVPSPFRTQSFNRYSYVENNPLSFTDPSGFTPECPICEAPPNTPVDGGWQPPGWFRHLTDGRGNTRTPASYVRYHNGAVPANEWDIPEGESRSGDVFGGPPPPPGDLEIIFPFLMLDWIIDELLIRHLPEGAQRPARIAIGMVTVSRARAAAGEVRQLTRDATDTVARTNRAASRAQGVPDRQIGPSGLPKRHSVEHSTRKAAREAAQREVPRGGRVRHDAHPRDSRQRPHFQAEDARGRNVRPVVHHEPPG